MAIVVDAGADRIQRTASGPNVDTFSIIAWVKRTATAAGTVRVIFYLDGSGDIPFSQLFWDTDEALKLWIHDGVGTGAYTFTNAPGTGVWFCVAVVATSINTANVYYWKANGTLVESGTASDATITMTDTAVNISVLMNHFSEFTTGMCAHGRLWDARLTQAELEREMRSPWPVRLTNLNTAFTGRDITITDVSGNARNWTGTSVALNEEMPPLPQRSFRQKPYLAAGAVVIPTSDIPGRRIYVLP